VIVFDSHPIEQKSSTNFLGLTIDQHLNWNEHVSKMITKINSGIYALSKMSFYCDLTTLKNIYFAYIHSHIAFGISLFGATKKANLDIILKQQKRAIRIMLKLKHDDSAKDHFKQLKILTVYGQYILDTILYAKNKIDNHIPQQSFHHYNTRKKNSVRQNQHRLKFFEKRPSYAGEKFFEFIPEQIKNEKNLIKFKKLLKEFLINEAIYSLEEFFNRPHNNS
jgi:hypothetical protein